MAKESTFKNMVLCLFLICLICSAVLAAVNVATQEPIRKANEAKINASIAAVLPEFDNDPYRDQFALVYEGEPVKVYPATKEGVPAGFAIETYSNKGFGGRIVLMVGFLPDGTIYNTSVISHAETPGLGDKMVAGKGDFSKQFEGKHPDRFRLAVKKDGGDVDAITASTITSRAFLDALERAYGIFRTFVQP